jgi:hypothetical protein|mmetsp:Transcript_12180/g.40434  ORF Transcript_12180/g.40434 Transcript_12180/m.40434 type:complete len:387 (+) Transcript_12180:259-1419(+)
MVFAAQELLRDNFLTAPSNMKLMADCSVYATANGLATLASNKDKFAGFAKNTRFLYKGWAHGYERAVAITGRSMMSSASAGAKGVLGPSIIYGFTMRLAATCGLPSLVAVGGANVATPLLVSKLGGPLHALPAGALAARALPIAAHCVIEWGLFQKFKEHMNQRASTKQLGGGTGTAGFASSIGASAVPKTRMKAVMDGALTGGMCAFAATATTVLALSPLYGGRLLHRAVTADSVSAAARLSLAAMRVTRIRLADSLQQGVVWFSTYEGMRAALSIYDEKKMESEWCAALSNPDGFTVLPEPHSEGSELSEKHAAVDAAVLGVSDDMITGSSQAAAVAEETQTPRRFERRQNKGCQTLSAARQKGWSGIDAQLSPRRKLLFSARG